MPISNWFATATRNPARAQDAWRRISEKPTSITIKRGTAALPAQTVRLEASNASTGNQVSGSAGISAKQTVILFGITGHPTLADTDVQYNDRFAVDGIQYRVVMVTRTNGEVQATCEALS